MKTKIYLALILTLSVSTVFSQGLSVGETGKQLKQTSAKESVGSPYFSDAFSKSSVETMSKKKITLNALRYNLFTQNLEYEDKNELYAVQDSLESFTMPDSSGKVIEFVKKTVNNKSGFYQVLVTGKAELLKRYNAKTETTTDWYTKKETRVMKQYVTYFISKDGKVEQVPGSAKGLLTLFSDKPNEVKAYIKEQSPDLKTEAGLTEVFKIYNGS